MKHIVESPLSWAFKSGHVEIIRDLISNGAHINQKDLNGKSPVFWACKGGLVDCIRDLIKNGANINERDNNGQSPLYWVCMHGRVEIVRLLINNGANINEKDRYGKTPLHQACRGRRAEVVRLLINKGANTNEKDEHGRSCLRWMCEKGHVTIVKQLLLSDHWDNAELGVQSAETSNKDISGLLQNASQPWRSNTEISALYPSTFQNAAEVLRDVFTEEPRFNVVAHVNELIVDLVLSYCDRAWFRPGAKHWM